MKNAKKTNIKPPDYTIEMYLHIKIILIFSYVIQLKLIKDSCYKYETPLHFLEILTRITLRHIQ